MRTRINACSKCFEHLTTATKEYRTGEHPPAVLNLLHATPLDLIHNEIEPIQRTQVCNKLITLVEDLHGYLSTTKADFNIEARCRIALEAVIAVALTAKVPA